MLRGAVSGVVDGAPRGHVLIGAGLVVGIVAALATTRLVSSFLFSPQANDPRTLGLAAAILTLVAAIPGYLPARRVSALTR